MTQTAPLTHAAPRVLVVRVGAMGDVLHAIPAVAALRQALPDAFLGWAIEPRWASLLQVGAEAQPDTSAMPLVDRVHPVETRLWSQRPFSAITLHSILRLRRAMRTERYDIAVDLQGSIRSAIIARLSGACLVIGSASPREGAARYLYGKMVPLSRPHVVEQAAEIAMAALRHLRGQRVAALVAAKTPLPVDTSAERWCDGLLAGNSRPLVFLAPTAGWGAKEWPAERYGAVAGELAARGYRVLVNAASATDAVAVKVVAAASHGAPVEDIQIVASTLPQMIAMLRRAALVIAGDTGPLHLAAALRVPTVAIFGPTDPARTGPFGNAATVLRDSSSMTDHRRNAETEPGLLRISAEMVVDAALQLLNPAR